MNTCNLISATTFSIILKVAFGIEMEYEERIRFSNDVTLLTEEIIQECFRWPIRQALVYLGSRKKMMECKERINAFCRRFIDERRQERSSQKASREPDLLDAILDLEGHSEEALLSIVLEFAMGGYHTTTQLLVWCLSEICCSPQVESRIHTELEKNLGHGCGHRTLSEDDVNRLPYLKSVWKESMRMHPPVAIILRAAATDVTLKGSGVRLPKGTHIYGNTRGLHRSSAIWADSNSFLPERWGSGRGASGAERVPAGSFVPFGIGQWNCAGRFLADYEGILILAEMHRQFKFTLACSPCDVKNYSLTVDSARFLDIGSGLDKHVPMYVELRGHSSDLSPGKV